MLSRNFALAAGALCGVFLLGCDMPSPQGENHPLVGRQAPLFTATMLDDSPFDLAEYLGKDVIILDFWATWCGPCREALPTLRSVAAQYEDQGVKLFAVNIMENPEVVREFLEITMLDVAVVMDRDDAINSLYQVQFLPQTVIIGRDGRIANVHVGAPAGLKRELTRELDMLVKETPAAQAGRTRPDVTIR